MIFFTPRLVSFRKLYQCIGMQLHEHLGDGVCDFEI